MKRLITFVLIIFMLCVTSPINAAVSKYSDITLGKPTPVVFDKNFVENTSLIKEYHFYVNQSGEITLQVQRPFDIKTRSYPEASIEIGQRNSLDFPVVSFGVELDDKICQGSSCEIKVGLKSNSKPYVYTLHQHGDLIKDDSIYRYISTISLQPNDNVEHEYAYDTIEQVKAPQNFLKRDVFMKGYESLFSNDSIVVKSGTENIRTLRIDT